MRRFLSALFLFVFYCHVFAQSEKTVTVWDLGPCTINLPSDLFLDEKRMETGSGIVIRDDDVNNFYCFFMAFEIDSDFNTRDRLIEECDELGIDAVDMGIIGLTMGTSEPMLLTCARSSSGLNVAIGVYPMREQETGLFFYIQESRSRDSSDNAYAFNVISSVRLKDE